MDSPIVEPDGKCLCASPRQYPARYFAQDTPNKVTLAYDKVQGRAWRPIAPPTLSPGPDREPSAHNGPMLAGCPAAYRQHDKMIAMYSVNSPPKAVDRRKDRVFIVRSILRGPLRDAEQMRQVKATSYQRRTH